MATRPTLTIIEPDDNAIAAEHDLEIAKVFESDLDLAYRLQMEEAIKVSLHLQPSSSSASSSSPPTLPNDDTLNLSTEQLNKLEQEIRDRLFIAAETKKTQEELFRRIHDHKVAYEIDQMSEDDWEEYGDTFELPYGEGCSKTVTDEVFRVYFKGLVTEQNVENSKSNLSGIGVAICDSMNNIIIELSKPILCNDMSSQGAELKALIHGLNAALELDLKRVVFYCHCYPIFQFVTASWTPKQRKIATLVNQVALLQEKFTFCNPIRVSQKKDNSFAYELAREAIVSQVDRPSDSSCTNVYETCAICYEDIDVGKMFSVDDCLHRFCFTCMIQHVKEKLLHGMVPKCPQEGCQFELKIDSCRKFLTPKLIDIMSQHVREASIPVAEKLYCPFPNCSALMSRSEALEYSKNEFVGPEKTEGRKCMKCQGQFCINCKVPWHNNMTCADYKKENPHTEAEDAKLKTLAERNLWRQCVKCNHMIELAAGCYHMTCRCGCEFCYICGAEWKDKKPTCSCRYWDEGNILDDSDVSEFDDDDDDEEDYDSDSDYYYN